MHLKLLATAGLLACVSLTGFLLRPTWAHPAPRTGGTPSLRRVKRSLGCVEVALSPESVPEWETAPRQLALAAQLITSETFIPSHYMQVGGEGVMEERGDGVRVCKGRMEGDKVENNVLLVKESSAKVQYVVFSSLPSVSPSLTLWFTCADSHSLCIHLLSEAPRSLVRREIQDSHSPDQHSSHTSGRSNGVRWGVGVCLAVVGFIGVLASLALCAHQSQAYEPDVPNAKTSEVADTNEPSATKSDSLVNLLNTESSSQDVVPSETSKSVTASVASSEGGSKHLPSPQSGSQEHLIQSGNETQEVQSKLLNSRASSSQEDTRLQSGDKEGQEVHSKNLPSTGMPMLETADSSQGKDENEGAYASVDKENGAYDYVDKVTPADQQDETGYAYATVGGAMGEGAAKPAEPKREDGDNKPDEQEGRDRGTGLPPYGKVTRHMVPVVRGSYSEIVTSASPILPPGRPRAVTEPIDPSQTDQKMAARDKHSHTESAAHLPLPQIPKLEVSEEMYDSIPDELKESAAAPADSGSGSAPAGSGASVAKPKPVRESLYESVEEAKEEAKGDVEEDMYESVPEDIRQSAPTPSSPATLSPTSPLPPAPRSPSLSRVKSEVPVPSSPALSHEDDDNGKKKGKDHSAAKGAKHEQTKHKAQTKPKDGKHEQIKHKALAKAKSDSGTEPRTRSLSALFGRKKTGTPASPKHKKEKDQHEPLSRVVTGGSVLSPTHLHPPSPPPMAAPPPPPDDEEDEDYPPDSAYDMIDVINPRAAAMLNKNGTTAKEKSASLPASMRTAGASVFHHVDHGPLPKVPEESAGGLVERERVKEDMDPEYDTVVIGQVQNEPSYDSVEVAKKVDAAPKLEPSEVVAAAEAEHGSGQTPSNKYARVSSHTATETVSTQDLSALTPEHDALGYAVVPAHLKTRKRAQSDVPKENKVTASDKPPRRKSAEWDDPGYDKITPSQAADTDNLTTPSPPMEPAYESVTDAMKEKQVAETAAASGPDVEVPYATVDIAAKRRSQMLRQMSGGGGGAQTLDANAAIVLHEQSPSPNPPPLPPLGDLGDLTEFQKPPVPDQDAAALELIGPDELRPPGPGNVVNPYSQIDVLVDPPYASIKNKTEKDEKPTKELQSEGTGEEENPYATVDNLTDGTSSASTNDPPYARIKRGAVVADDDSENPSESVTMSGTAEDPVNGSHIEEGAEDTYNRLDHSFGSASTCRANTVASPGGQNQYSTITLDFPTSPSGGNVNGVDSRHVEETTVDFAD